MRALRFRAPPSAASARAGNRYARTARRRTALALASLGRTWRGWLWGRGRRHVLPRLDVDVGLELAVFSTLAAICALAATAAFGSAADAWAVAAGLAVLLAIGLRLLPMVEPRVRLERWEIVGIVAGAVVLLAAPAAVLFGAAPSLFLALATSLSGAGALTGVGVLRREVPEVLAPWCAAIPALLAAATAIVIGASLGDAGIAMTLGAGAAPVALAAIVLAKRRMSRRTAVRALDQARRDMAAGDSPRSLTGFDRAIAAAGRSPETGAALAGRGAALAALGRFEEAIASLDTAIRLHPNDEVAWLNRGNALTGLGRLVDALRSYNAALRVNPRYEVAWNNKGNTLARLGHFAEAVACYDQALAIDAAYTAAWVNKGLALTRLRDYEGAGQCADRAVELST